MSDPFIGEISMFGFNFPPRGWATCDGQLLPIAQNTALFSLLGTTFGGDGRTTFGLPDLRGRSAKHVGTGPGLEPVTWGERGGREDVTLTVNNMPSHNHGLRGNSGQPDESNPEGGYPANSAATGEDLYNGTSNVNMGPTLNTGGGQSFDIQNPYLGIYHCIALIGLFPSRA